MREEACEELAGRQRGEGERLGTFMADIRRLARRGYPSFSAEVQEELALQAFLRGLQEHVCIAFPSLLMVVLAETKKAEVSHTPTKTGHHVRYVAARWLTATGNQTSAL